MLIFRLIVLFWITTSIRLHAFVLKKHISVLTLSGNATCVLAPVSLRSSLLNIRSLLIGYH